MTNADMEPGIAAADEGTARPKVSIVMPVYNGEKYLAQAIESCLGQTYRSLELILVDDTSTDGSREIAEEYAAKYRNVQLICRRKNGGVSRAFNAGFQSARGDYFTRLAQDDYFEPCAIETLVDFLERNQDAGLVCADETKVDESGTLISVHKCAVPYTDPDGWNEVGLCVMWRREIWDRVGEFDPRFDAAEDREYWLRAAKAARFARCPCVPLLNFRQHVGMGSVKFRRKQSLASALGWSKHCPDVGKRKLLAALAHFDASWGYRCDGDALAGIRHAATATLICPGHRRFWHGLAGATMQAIGILKHPYGA